MESELAACPVCGGECKLLTDNDGAYCVSPDCGHYEVLPVEAHNTLARRAEIGFLIEELSGANVGVSLPPNTAGAAILDALRALKNEEWLQ